MLTTTLQKIKSSHPCESGWKKLCKSLKTTDPETPVTLLQVLESNKLDDALWCLRCWDYPDYSEVISRIVESVEHLSTDPAVAECNRVTRRFNAGSATIEELQAAADAPWAAAWAAGAAGAAARAARAAAMAAWAAGAADAAEAAAEAARAARAAAEADRGTSILRTWLQSRRQRHS